MLEVKTDTKNPNSNNGYTNSLVWLQDFNFTTGIVWVSSIESVPSWFGLLWTISVSRLVFTWSEISVYLNWNLWNAIHRYIRNNTVWGKLDFWSGIGIPNVVPRIFSWHTECHNLVRKSFTIGTDLGEERQIQSLSRHKVERNYL